MAFSVVRGISGSYTTASSAGASCATLLPWMPTDRNGDFKSQVRIVNRGVLSTARPAGRFLLIGLFGGAAGATPAPSARSKDSLSPSVAVSAASSVFASVGQSSPHSTASLSSYSSSSSSLSSLLLSVADLQRLRPDLVQPTGR